MSTDTETPTETTPETTVGNEQQNTSESVDSTSSEPLPEETAPVAESTAAPSPIAVPTSEKSSLKTVVLEGLHAVEKAAHFTAAELEQFVAYIESKI